MKNFICIIALAAVISTCAACSSTKKATSDTTTVTGAPITQSNDNVASRAKAIASSHGSWTTLQCSGTFTLGGKKTFSSSVAVRMERDKFIYISLRPILGIEVGRLVFSGDSVIIVDKIHHQYIAENVKLLTNGLPATVSTLQDIFLGRSFTIDGGTYTTAHTADATAENKGDKLCLKPAKATKGFTYEFAYDNANHITELSVTPDDEKIKDTYTVKYNDVHTTKAGNIAHSLNIASTIKGKALSMSLEYRNINWNEPVKADTSIPGNYKKANSDNINDLLSGE